MISFSSGGSLSKPLEEVILLEGMVSSQSGRVLVGIPNVASGIALDVPAMLELDPESLIVDMTFFGIGKYL